METLQLLFNTVTVVFIATTMFAAGLGTTLPALRAVLATPSLPLLALLANLVVIPLLGWGIATLFGLSAAAFIALVLAASSPGGPFGAKLSMLKNGDVVAGTVIQVLLAAVGSLTFGLTANGILALAEVGGGISLDVAALVRTVAILQLVPFAVGLTLRHYAPLTAQLWHHAATKTSTVTFMAVLAGMLLGNWQAVVALLGSRILLAGAVLAIAAFAVGMALATGPRARRASMGGVAAVRNAGPVLAAIGIAFDDDPAILAAFAGVLVSGMAVALPIAAVLARDRDGGAA
ncbi:bile acid:sodium symporter [Streptosporangium roseum]|uniref:bile acid:sodium symporter n=1 Tax=Streptosporangium roseum TaxID=2001 RepID=UPI0004CDCC3F|nr:bile acid:sodium symporter [Streptosporangium roseum]